LIDSLAVAMLGLRSLLGLIADRRADRPHRLPSSTQRGDLLLVIARQMALASHGNTPSVSSTNW